MTNATNKFFNIMGFVIMFLAAGLLFFTSFFVDNLSDYIKYGVTAIASIIFAWFFILYSEIIVLNNKLDHVLQDNEEVDKDEVFK